MSDIKKTRTPTPAIIKELRAKLKVCLLDQKACSLSVDSCWLDKESQWYEHVYYSSADCEEDCDYREYVEHFLDCHYENMMRFEAALNSFDRPILEIYDLNLCGLYKLKECFYKCYIKEVQKFIKKYGEWDEALYILGAR